MSGFINLEIDSRQSRYTRQADDQPIAGYRLLSRLGLGGFGEVWKCSAPDGTLKAIKIVRCSPDPEAAQTAFVEHEHEVIRRLKHIRHPYLMSFERVDKVFGELFIVMGLADSSLLREFGQHRLAGRQGIPEDEILHYLLEAAEVLDMINLQHGLQHLNVKPANLLISNRHMKLADFGLVSAPVAPRGRQKERVIQFDDALSTIEIGEPAAELAVQGCPSLSCFTPRYAAPELLQGSVSCSCDQYTLALVYQELLTGTLPFEAGGLLKRLTAAPNFGGLPETVRPIVARALAANSKQRFSSCLEFVHALYACKASSRESRPRIGQLNSPTLRQALPEHPLGQSIVSKTDEESLIETPLNPTRLQTTAAHLSTSGNSADVIVRTNVSLTPTDRRETSPPNDRIEQIECQSEISQVIYPPTIQIADLRWKRDPEGEFVLRRDDFIARLVAAVTEPGCLPDVGQTSPFRQNGQIIEDSFVMSVNSQQELWLKFDEVVSQCRAVEVLRSERLFVCAVECALPFWGIFSSLQRVLKITVKVELPNEQHTNLCKVIVRIDPFFLAGPELHPRVLDIRFQLLRKIRSILEVAPERRRHARASCHFGVELYPILRDWHFGPALVVRAIDLSAHGVGLMAPVQPSTTRYYLRPTAPNPLSDYAILAEVVRHSPHSTGFFAWGMALGRI